MLQALIQLTIRSFQNKNFKISFFISFFALFKFILKILNNVIFRIFLIQKMNIIHILINIISLQHCFQFLYLIIFTPYNLLLLSHFLTLHIHQINFKILIVLQTIEIVNTFIMLPLNIGHLQLSFFLLAIMHFFKQHYFLVSNFFNVFQFCFMTFSLFVFFFSQFG